MTLLSSDSRYHLSSLSLAVWKINIHEGNCDRKHCMPSLNLAITMVPGLSGRSLGENSHVPLSNLSMNGKKLLASGVVLLLSSSNR